MFRYQLSKVFFSIITASIIFHTSPTILFASRQTSYWLSRNMRTAFSSNPRQISSNPLDIYLLNPKLDFLKPKTYLFKPQQTHLLNPTKRYTQTKNKYFQKSYIYPPIPNKYSQKTTTATLKTIYPLLDVHIKGLCNRSSKLDLSVIVDPIKYRWPGFCAILHFHFIAKVVPNCHFKWWMTSSSVLNRNISNFMDYYQVMSESHIKRMW